MSLVARHLEASGIATVVVGSARDVVEQCGVPRFVFTDYPLGNPCGRPWAPSEQAELVGLALDLLEQAFAPRTTVQAPVVWSDDITWKHRYMAVEPPATEHAAADPSTTTRPAPSDGAVGGAARPERWSHDPSHSQSAC